MSKECVDKLKSFLSGSDTFAGVTFQGLYGMSTDHFLLMYGHYLETGENHLDEYSEMTWLEGKDYMHDNHRHFEYFDKDKRVKIKKYISGDSFWKFESFVSKERLIEIKADVVLSEREDNRRETYEYRRRKASAHTNKKTTKEAVFEIHGKRCKTCGSTNKIEIDHVIPVIHGGSNDITNLQPLCKSCNSSKGGTI